MDTHNMKESHQPRTTYLIRDGYARQAESDVYTILNFNYRVVLACWFS